MLTVTGERKAEAASDEKEVCEDVGGRACAGARGHMWPVPRPVHVIDGPGQPVPRSGRSGGSVKPQPLGGPSFFCVSRLQ
jgi:hypothetical protein